MDQGPQVPNHIPYLDLSGKNFEGVDLASLPFSRYLGGAKLIGTNLRNAKMLGLNMTKADFSRAQLQGADLSMAHLQGAIFDDAGPDGSAPGVRTFGSGPIQRSSAIRRSPGGR